MIFFLESEFWHKVSEKLSEWAISQLPSILLTVFVFIIGMFVINKFTKRLEPFLINRKFIERSPDKLEAQKRISTLIKIVRSSARVILWVIFIILILSKMGVDVAPLLAGAGILGLAVGFGAQELVRDVISGFFILLENQIRVGDVATINGTTGDVEKIELRTITLRDLSGVVHIFQNGKISTLANLTKGWSATVLEIGVAYKENVSKIIDLMKQVCDEMRIDEKFSKFMIEDIDILGLDKFDDSAVIIKAVLKSIPGEQWVVKREYLKRLKFLFDSQKIEIPVPHTKLLFAPNQPAIHIKTEK